MRHKERDDGGRKGGTWSINPTHSPSGVQPAVAGMVDTFNLETEESIFQNAVKINVSAFNTPKNKDISLNTKHKNVSLNENANSFVENEKQTNYSTTPEEEAEAMYEANSLAKNSNQKRQITGLDEFRRKSVEDFLEMNHVVLGKESHTLEEESSSQHRKKVRIHKTRTRSSNQIATTKDDIVPLPPSSTSSFAARSRLFANISEPKCLEDNKIILDLDIQNRQFPYDGSMDYWEQYDLEVVQRNGLAVITSNEDKSLLRDDAFCFLCGSKGK